MTDQPNPIEQFLTRCTVNGNSSRTLETYDGILQGLGRHLLSMNLNYVTAAEDDLKRFLKIRTEQGLKPATLILTAIVLKKFFAWMRYEGLREDTPAKSLTVPQRVVRIPEVLSVEETKRLIQATCGGRFCNIRTRALVALMYATGARPSELTSLTEADLDLNEGFIRVIGKRNKLRILPVPPTIKPLLDEYIAEKKFKFPNTPFVFVTYRGHQMDRQTIWLELKNLARRAGITTAFSPVILRHTFATHLLWGGADLKSIKNLMGHSRLDYTDIYSHLTPHRLRRNYFQAHPLAKKNGVMSHA